VAAIRIIEFSRRAHARSWDVALLVCAVGIAGLVRDSWPGAAQGSWIHLHAVFGLLLWIMVVAQFQQRARAPSLMHGVNFDASCRQLSRAVYLLLYVLFGADQIIRAGVLLWNGEAFGASHPAIVQPPENLRDYLAYGVLALLTIRTLAALHRRTLKRGALFSALPNYQHHE
jgi:cytochrome b561